MTCQLCNGSSLVEYIPRGCAWEPVPSAEDRPNREPCPVCFVEPAPACSGCGEVVELVGVVSEDEGYCGACSFAIVAAVKCQVIETTGEAVAS